MPAATLTKVRKFLDFLERAEQLDGRTSLDDVKLADEMVKEGKDVLGDVLETVRACVTADRIFLTNLSMRNVGVELDYSHNAIGTYWIKKYGPKKYVTVRRESDQYFIEAVPPKSLKYLKGVDRRVAPSIWGLYDNDTDSITYEGTPEELWDRLPELPAEE